MFKVTVHRTVKGAPTTSWVQRVLKELWGALPKDKKRTATSCVVIFVGDRRMRTLNSMHRGKDRPTDVLAFPNKSQSWAGKEEDGLGEVFIDVAYIEHQARRVGCSRNEELARMLTHGVLHLLGYSHYNKTAATRMFAIQERVVSKLG